MFAQSTVIFSTSDLNLILKQIDWDELRKNERIEFQEKDEEELNKEGTKIHYELCTNDSGPIVNATILTYEYYDDIDQPIELTVKLSKQELLDLITEYFHWQGIPYEALKIDSCTEIDEKANTKGKEDFGTMTVIVSKLKQKTRERKNEPANMQN